MSCMNCGRDVRWTRADAKIIDNQADGAVYTMILESDAGDDEVLVAYTINNPDGSMKEFLCVPCYSAKNPKALDHALSRVRQAANALNRARLEFDTLEALGGSDATKTSETGMKILALEADAGMLMDIDADRKNLSREEWLKVLVEWALTVRLGRHAPSMKHVEEDMADAVRKIEAAQKKARRS